MSLSVFELAAISVGMAGLLTVAAWLGWLKLKEAAAVRELRRDLDDCSLLGN